jgi:DNA-binding CsgD family transcriptional regulator
VIAGNDYKRAERMVEAADAARAPDAVVPGGVLRLSWALSRIAAVPTPDLAQQLADALANLCEGDHAVSVQLGRLDVQSRWQGEAFGASGRLPADAAGHFAGMAALPRPHALGPLGAPWLAVSEVAGDEPSLRIVEAAMRRVHLGIELATVARPAEAGGIALAVQLGGRRDGRWRARAPLLADVLPWAHAIARVALGEVEGLLPRAWLSDTERVVLQKLVRGDSVMDIAAAMGRSKFTVHDSVKSLHRKLGVHTRAALVGCATMGVAPPEALE